MIFGIADVTIDELIELTVSYIGNIKYHILYIISYIYKKNELKEISYI